MKNLVKAITGSTKAPKVKVPAAAEDAPPTPLADPEELKRAAMREELLRRKSGRASTIIADDEDKL